MAFHDMPIIDRFSNNREKSEQALRKYFTEPAGFRCRTDVPDNGCDFDIELIKEKSATSWRFPVQLKSVEKIKKVEEGAFITYSFETSRFGYLMRRIPAMGIIVLYSVEEDVCYYDLTNLTYQRLVDERDNDDWKANDTVSIRIPVTQVLDENTAKEIHETMHLRFENAMQMQASHGAKYGLPTQGLGAQKKFDFSSTDDIKAFLLEYGMLLASNFELGDVYRYVSTLPSRDVYNNAELLVISAIASSECGYHAESELFIRKLNKGNFVLSEDYQLMIKFASIKNRLVLGELTMGAYLKELRAIPAKNDNGIIVDINITRYELADRKAMVQREEDLLVRINQIFERIDKSTGPKRQKAIMQIWNADNIGHLLSERMSEGLGRMQMRASLGNPLTMSERLQALQELMPLHDRFNEIIQAAYAQAMDKDDKLLQAYCLQSQVRSFMHYLVNILAFRLNTVAIPGWNEQMNRMVEVSMLAYNKFAELNLGADMYESICSGIEISTAAEKVYQMKTTIDRATMIQAKQKLEQIIDGPVHQPVLDSLIDRILHDGEEEEEENPGNMPMLAQLDDRQMEVVADTVMESFRLPPDRRKNVLAELSAYRMFNQRCKDTDVIVLQWRNYNIPDAELYRIPIQFVLRRKKSGVETPPSSDMNRLLEGWGF